MLAWQLIDLKVSDLESTARFGRFRWSLLTLSCVLFCVPAIYSDAAPTPSIVISGAPGALEENIRSHLRIDNEACGTSLLRLGRLTGQVERNVEAAGQALGYYQTRFQTAFSKGEACWELRIEVEPGPAVLLAEINVEIMGGEEARDIFTPLVVDSGLITGSQLHHGRYENLKTQLSALAVDMGYFNARFSRAEIGLNLIQMTADVNLAFDPGERFRFGEVDISSGNFLSESLIRNYIPFASGDPYSSDELAQLRQNLNESEFFSQIMVSPQLSRDSDNRIPVSVTLTERPRHFYSAGVGFTTDTGPRVRFNYENRYFNPSGHTTDFESSLSKVRSQGNASYVIPLKNAARQSLRFRAGILHEDTDTYISDGRQLQASIRTLTTHDWQQIYSLQFQRDDYRIGSESDVTILSIPGMSLSKTQADNLINPGRGWRLFLELKGASDALLSDTSFVQFYGSAKHIVSAGNFRILSRFEAGATAIDEAEDLPASLRFFTGGDQSVRGFDYQTLGTVDKDGITIGGKHKLAASVELDYAFQDNWRAAVFVDAGNAFDNFSNVTIRQSAGLGIRWQSPIGPLRVDIARPLDSDEGYRLHITMGPDL